jgi:hypothetical protein
VCHTREKLKNSPDGPNSIIWVTAAYGSAENSLQPRRENYRTDNSVRTIEPQETPPVQLTYGGTPPKEPHNLHPFGCFYHFALSMNGSCNLHNTTLPHTESVMANSTAHCSNGSQRSKGLSS